MLGLGQMLTKSRKESFQKKSGTKQLKIQILNEFKREKLINERNRLVEELESIKKELDNYKKKECLSRNNILSDLEKHSGECSDPYSNDLKIRGRTNSFGVTVERPDSDEDIFSVFEESEEAVFDNFFYSPQTLAKAVLAISGFDVEYSDFFDLDNILDWGFDYLVGLADDLPTKRKRDRISSRALALGVKSFSKAHSRISDVKVPKREQKRQLIIGYLVDNFGDDFRDFQVFEVIKKIHEIVGDKMPVPKENDSIDNMIDFLVDNIGPFWSSLNEMSF